ncbi:MAG TPA: hypothetical protein VIG64_03955, partial [Actinomycetota bacterium]
MADAIKVVSWNIQVLGEAKAAPQTRGAPKTSGTPKASGSPTKKQKTSSAGSLGPFPRIVKTLSAEIIRMQAQVVGIMEVAGGQGQKLVELFKSYLNEREKALVWDGRSSSSAGTEGRNEEYIFLWRDPVVLDKNASPGPLWSIGVVDDNALFGVTPPSIPDRLSLY